MKILIGGASGLIGSHLVEVLQKEGHEVGRLVRRSADRTVGEVYWDPERGSIDKSALEAFRPEAVINLSGENISSHRWSEAQKRRIFESRVKGTLALSKALAHLKEKPSVFINASAMGYYGDRGEEWLTEDSSPGNTFLADVCKNWEQSTNEAQEAGIRVVLLRTGMVLSKKGGALKKMLTPFKLGVGGVVGHGKQFYSWITLEDLSGIVLEALKNPNLKGPVNASTPNPVTNKEFTKTLGSVLWRPTLFPLPASTARLFIGEMAEGLLLASARQRPVKLKEIGFEFQHPELKEALKAVLGKK